MNSLYRRELHLLEAYNGEKIAFDIATSSIIYLDKLAYKIIDSGPIITPTNVIFRLKESFNEKEIKETLEELIDIGILSDKPQEEENLDSEDIHDILVGGISLNISHHCNMKCCYCFGGGGAYGGPKENMTKEIAKEGIDYLFSHCGKLMHCIISFFGGEPFLNWDVMQWAINYAHTIAVNRNITLTFFITTNGTLLTEEILDFLNRFNVTLTISIDGPKKIHDAQRKFLNGRGTYDVVVKNIALALKYTNLKVQSRPTLTPKSCGMVDEIYRHILHLGIKRMHARPESQYANRPKLSLKDYSLMIESLDNLAKEMICKVDNKEYWGVINILKFMNMLYFQLVRHDYCGTGLSILSISPDGTIFPCPRFTGKKEFKLGNILSGIDVEKQLIFLNNAVENRSGCKRCWARYICGGGCTYMHWASTGDIKLNDPDWCIFTKKSIEIAIKSYSYLQNKEDKMIEFFKQYTPFLSDFGDGVDELFALILNERR